jgi:SagB-type dehydrogenase family enzyme
LRTYLVAERVADLVPGVHAYIPGEQRLRQVEHVSTLSLLAAAACGQEWIADAPAVLVFSAAYAVTTGRYGERGQRYIDIEVGHAAQNAHLQATALGLCSVVVGAFDDAVVARLLHLDPSESPLCLLPVGRPRECAKKR